MTSFFFANNVQLQRLSYNPLPISKLTEHNSPTKQGSYAVFFCCEGNTTGAFASTVLRACSRISSRFSIKNRTTPAASRCTIDSSHSILARLRHWAEESRDLSSNSVRLCCEHSIKNSRDGKRRFGFIAAAPCKVQGPSYPIEDLHVSPSCCQLLQGGDYLSCNWYAPPGLRIWSGYEA